MSMWTASSRPQWGPVTRPGPWWRALTVQRSVSNNLSYFWDTFKIMSWMIHQWLAPPTKGALKLCSHPHKADHSRFSVSQQDVRNESPYTTAVFWLAYLRKFGSNVSHWLKLPLLWSAAGNTNATPYFSILISDTVSLLINWIAWMSQWIIWPIITR